MNSPFAHGLTWWHWQGGVVEQATIAELAQFVTARTPNAAGIAVKSSNGRDWQGVYQDPNPDMAITGPQSIARWVDVLAQHSLDTHLWCVVHGQDVPVEAERIITACRVPGVRSMILDVEAGDRYFGSHPPQVARDLISRIRHDIPPDFHLGLCLFVRDNEPRRIHIDEWLPHVNSLHPMVYHWDFSDGTGEPEPYLDETFDVLGGYDLPVVPILGTYADPTSGHDVPAEHLYRGATHALQKGAAGISLFRLGATGPGASEALSRIQFD
jgi:hypothetical protein